MNFGRLVQVENSGSGRGNSCYNQVTFVNPNGDVEQVLLTDRELSAARDRAGKNADSLSGVSWLDRLAAFKVRVLSRLLSLLK